MISSARTRMDSGILMPSALAVLRFTTRLNLVGCSNRAGDWWEQELGRLAVRLGYLSVPFWADRLLRQPLIDRAQHRQDFA